MSELTIDDILNCPSLPSLPAAAVEVLDLTRDRNVNLRKVAVAVQNDPALTAKILKTVNSSYYGLARPCPTILRALTYLGLNTVKSLVLGFSLVDVTKRSRTDFDFGEFWKRSLYSAAASRRLAGLHRESDPEEVFIASLMQDIGMLALQMTIAHKYGKIIAETEGDHRRLCGKERSAIGLDHGEVGGAFGNRWRLPQVLTDAIAHHHRPDDVIDDGEGRLAFVRTVCLSSDLVIAMNLGKSETAISRIRRLAYEWFGIEDKDIDTLLEQVAGDARQLAQLFKIDMPQGPDRNRILAEAQDEAVKAQLEQQREVEALQRCHDELAVKAATDQLTDIGNRGRFDELLARLFEETCRLKRPLGLLILDVDHFKKLNDTYGHPAGDAVLVQLAQRIGDVIRDRDLVSRYGGEEFAVVIPKADARSTAAIAERLRTAIDSHPFHLDDNPDNPETVHVTVSIGVASADSGATGVISTADLLVRAADKALYAAKDAGRNCVRVFRTRPAEAA